MHSIRVIFSLKKSFLCSLVTSFFVHVFLFSFCNAQKMIVKYLLYKIVQQLQPVRFSIFQPFLSLQIFFFTIFRFLFISFCCKLLLLSLLFFDFCVYLLIVCSSDCEFMTAPAFGVHGYVFVQCIRDINCLVRFR